MALIEIEDFPSERNLHLWLGFSMANCECHNQMVYPKLRENIGMFLYVMDENQGQLTHS
jgi:hypothetical protein